MPAGAQAHEAESRIKMALPTVRNSRTADRELQAAYTVILNLLAIVQDNQNRIADLEQRVGSVKVFDGTRVRDGGI